MKEETGSQKWLTWVSRVLILVVLIWNLDAAVAFMAAPESFLAGFELNGVPGKIAIAGTGLLFLMWQVPYVFAILHPVKYRISVFEALAMQSIGLIGETLLWMNLPKAFGILRGSILRFIIFDGIGLLLIILSIVLTKKK